jgi:hypothetical protein
MLPYMRATGVSSSESDPRRPNLGTTVYTLLLTATLPALWPLYSLFRLTPAGPGVRKLTTSVFGCYTLDSLVVHIALFGYHDRWDYAFPYVPHGLLLPLWSGATRFDYELFAARLQDLGVPAVYGYRREPNGARWYWDHVYIPTTELYKLEALVGPLLPVWAKHLVRRHY